MNDFLEQLESKTNEDDELMEQASYVVVFIGEYAIKHLCKEICRTNKQIGHAWVQEVLQGHPIHCYEMFCMEKHIFYMLCSKLVDHVKGNKNLQERF